MKNLRRYATPAMLWPLWVVATTIGAGVAVGVLFFVFAFSGLGGEIAALLFMLLLLSILPAAAQLWVLRLYGYSARWWVWATFLSWVVAFGLFWFVSQMPGPGKVLQEMAMLPLLLIGLLGGLAQWAVLARELPLAWLWAPASVVGWWLFTLLIGQDFAGLVQLVLSGTIPAMVTGLVLVVGETKLSSDLPEKGAT